MSLGTLVKLCPAEPIRQDAGPIAAIYRNLGPVSAEQVVTKALTEIALALSGIAHQVGNRDLATLGRQLRRLQAMATNLGMLSLADVAMDLCICLDRCDSTAFAAVWARLLRIAERSLAQDRDLLDQSIF